MKNKTKSISKIAVKGFKSIYDEIEIDIKPLTILSGANSSGKSSIMQPLLLLKQTLDAPADPGALKLDGANTAFTSTEQLFSRDKTNKNPEFSIRIQLTNNHWVKTVFGKGPKPGLEVNETEYLFAGTPLRVTKKMKPAQLVASIPESYRDMTKDSLKKVSRERCFLFPEFFFETDDRQSLWAEVPSFAIRPQTDFVSSISSVIHLPGLRGNPQRYYPINSVDSSFVGTIDFYTASIIHKWQTEKSPKLKELINFLKQLGLSTKIKAKSIDDTRIEIQVSRRINGKSSDANDLVSIADVGFGVSQALPAIVAILVAEPGQLVYLEQPEIHLHPKAQRNMAVILAQAAKRNIKIVVETHSIILLREIQTIIAKGELSPKQVALHWFSRNDEGKTTVTTAELDEDGAYGDWPEDFDQVDLEVEQTYLDVLEEKQHKKATADRGRKK
jgi:predicted ATPase